MATIPFDTTTPDKFRRIRIGAWRTAATGDTITPALIPSGHFTISVEGTIGGSTITFTLGQSPTGPNPKLDPDILTFTNTGHYNITMGGGYLTPVLTGGSANVTIYVNRIIQDADYK